MSYAKTAEPIEMQFVMLCLVDLGNLYYKGCRCPRSMGHLWRCLADWKALQSVGFGGLGETVRCATVGLILMVCTSYDLFLHREVPFGGCNDCSWIEIFSGINLCSWD